MLYKGTLRFFSFTAQTFSARFSRKSHRKTCPSSPAVKTSYGICGDGDILCTDPACLNKTLDRELNELPPSGDMVMYRTWPSRPLETIFMSDPPLPNSTNLVWNTFEWWPLLMENLTLFDAQSHRIIFKSSEPDAKSVPGSTSCH